MSHYSHKVKNTLANVRLKYLITTSGNCEIFITFYRNNTENLFQYLKKNKYIHGSLNREYNDNVTQVWY